MNAYTRTEATRQTCRELDEKCKLIEADPLDVFNSNHTKKADRIEFTGRRWQAVYNDGKRINDYSFDDLTRENVKHARLEEFEPYDLHKYSDSMWITGRGSENLYFIHNRQNYFCKCL